MQHRRAAFIDSGSSWQNGFTESFNAQFRCEQHSGEAMVSMLEAMYLADEWKDFKALERPDGFWFGCRRPDFGISGLVRIS